MPEITTAGAVMAIGGAEDKLRDKVILKRFLTLAGGAEARIVVISTASSLGQIAADVYRELFDAMGSPDVVGLRPVTRDEANDERAVEAFEGASGIFLTGGNQLRLSAVVGGTRVGAAITAAHARGAVVGGTSAGASAVATHMMAFGASGATPKHRMAQMSAGLGLLKNVVIDQHFEQRTRLGRLLAVVAQSPSLVGLGLDEDTAIVVEPDETLEVIGRGAVTIVDGSRMITDAFHTKGHRPMMISGAILHSLPSGHHFDLRNRTLLPFSFREDVKQPALRKAARGRLARLSRTMAAEGANSFVLDRRHREEEAEEPREAAE